MAAERLKRCANIVVVSEELGVHRRLSASVRVGPEQGARLVAETMLRLPALFAVPYQRTALRPDAPSPYGWNLARGHGRAPTHHPRLSASQQSEYDEQTLAGHMQQQAVGARQVGRRDFADRPTVAKQVNAHPIKHSDRLMEAAQWRESGLRARGNAYCTQMYPDRLGGFG